MLSGEQPLAARKGWGWDLQGGSLARSDHWMMGPHALSSALLWLCLYQ